jgi:subtilisin family serine protease
MNHDSNMETRSFYYNGESGERFDLLDSDDLMIIRTRGISADIVLQMIPGLIPYKNQIQPVDSFPESDVYLYKCVYDKKSAAFRDEVKAIVRASNHPLLIFVGTVLKFKGTEIYQIYTGNIFIKFHDKINAQVISQILHARNVKVKALLNIGNNAFFSEPEEEIGRDVFELTQHLLRLPEVEYCHPELIIKARKVLGNDLDVTEPTTMVDPDWILKKTGVLDAWKISRGAGSKICIMDDGLDFDHPAFCTPNKIVAARDMMDKTLKRLPLHQFDERHGTACASIACSADLRAWGVAPDAALIPIRIAGLGSILQSEAFYWAVEQGADVISCSWGPPDGSIFSETDNDFAFPIPDHTNLAIRYATSKGRNGKGTPVVFAAGNGKEPVKNDGYASHESVFAIGASNRSDQPTVYSDYGYPMLCCFPSGDFKILSPTNVRKLEGVTVADRLGNTGYTLGSYYNFFDGTSASCPGVAGVIALMLGANPHLSQGEIKTIIKNASKKIGSPNDYENGYSKKYGYGLLMADKAVEFALASKTLNTPFPMTTTPDVHLALSLHIGINKVDPAYYQGIVPPLFGCLKDMANMRDMAQKLGYKTISLENAQATRTAILQQIESLGKLLGPGGTLLITYAGHGAPIPDSDNDEIDRQDESWVTYDGFLLDDEINNCLASIPAGRRVVLVSDSCHSQTVTRELLPPDVRVRSISKELVQEILKENNATISQLRAAIGPKLTPSAYIKLLSACKDNQFAKETGGAGVFSTRLLEILNELSKQQKLTTYSDLITKINDRMNDSQQVAGMFNSGATSAAFDNEHPFTVTSNGVISAAPGSSAEKIEQKIPVITQKKQPLDEVLIIKSSKNSVKIPVKRGSRAVNPEIQNVRILGGTIEASQIPGATPWDKAYQVLVNNPGANISYIEPDIASNIYLDTLTAPEDAQRAIGISQFLPSYPNPGTGAHAFSWHLDNDHSQLKRANEQVFPEILFQDHAKAERNLVKIAHIDTGYIPRHPARPVNLDPAAATFIENIRFDGAEDFDAPIAIAEQQGHGNATMAILAGGKLCFADTDDEFQGFFGAIPFARILSLKISESVALLSGNRFAAAVDYAIAQKCEVITMSMAGLPSKVMAEAVNKAYEAGIVIVSAAGNNFVKGIAKILPKTTLYPARYPQTIAAVGAAMNGKPYLYDLHKNDVRSTDSEFMQMNYGPADALETSLAGYTPNLMWFNCKETGDDGKPRYFSPAGGGTSSATPQIAAAAALYIQQYRSELHDIAGAEKWKIVEIVKSALFCSANKPAGLLQYYGNGILRASDALQRKPEEFATKIKKVRPADGGGNIFKRLFRVFSGRSAVGASAQEEEKRLQDMMSMEITQLLHRDENLHKYLDKINLEPAPDDDTVLDLLHLDDFVRDLQNSDKASVFLRQRLIVPPAQHAVNDLIFSTDRSNFNNVSIPTSKGIIEIRSAGISATVKSVHTDQTIEDWEGGMYHAFEIEIDSLGSRGTDVSLSIADQFHAENADMESVLLVEKEVDGQKLLQWQIKGENGQVTALTSRGLGGDATLIETNQFFINLEPAISSGQRGGGKIGKFFIKVFNWIKPKKNDNNKPTPFNELVEQMGDSKYELLVYDLNRLNGTGREWQSANELTDIFKSISDDPKPLLVFIPGLLSKVEKGFDEFLANPDVVTNLKKKFGRYVLGYNMPTLLRGIKDNATQLSAMLTTAGLKQKTCSVIGRSSGGLIARHLFEDTWVTAATGKPKADAPLILEKLITTGTSNQGTLLASKENWSHHVTIATNILNFTIGTVVPVIPRITGIIKAIINTAIDLPGVRDLDEQSEVILRLNRITNVNRTGYFIITSNFEPNGFLKKLVNERIIDRLIFQGEDNDTLAPVLGAIWRNEDLENSVVLPEDQFHICSELDEINHFSYLKAENKALLKIVLDQLAPALV